MNKETQLRILAGILMILGAFIGFLISRTLFTSIQVWVAWLSTLWMIIIIAGGIATLRKSSFNFCLFSSILLLPIASIPFLALSDTFSTTMMSETNIPFIIFITIVFLIIGLFPLFSITARKWDWGS